MNLPNQLTIGRLFLTALFVAVMSIPDQLLKSVHLLDYRITIATLFFLIASLTDFLDGYIARKLNLVTDFGKLMDPLVDKILTSAVFIILSNEPLLKYLKFINQPMFGNLLIIICTTITVISGWSYLSKNRELVKTN